MSEEFRVEAMLEAFNLFNHVNGVALNGSFGSGTYPTNPSLDVQADDGGCRSENLAVRVEDVLLVGKTR